MDKQIAQNAIAFLARVDLKGAEAVELVKVLQVLNNFVNAPEPAIVTEPPASE